MDKNLDHHCLRVKLNISDLSTNKVCKNTESKQGAHRLQCPRSKERNGGYMTKIYAIFNFLFRCVPSLQHTAEWTHGF